MYQSYPAYGISDPAEAAEDFLETHSGIRIFGILLHRLALPLAKPLSLVTCCRPPSRIDELVLEDVELLEVLVVRRFRLRQLCRPKRRRGSQRGGERVY